MKLFGVVSPLVLVVFAIGCGGPLTPEEAGAQVEAPAEVVRVALATPPCQLLRNQGSLTDGEYTVTVSGRAMSIYCHGMSGTPREYLTLRRTLPGSNVSRGANTLATTFQRIRLDTETLLVDVNDFTFATSTGVLWMGGNTYYSALGYGVAADCLGGSSMTGFANVDLSGTPFAVAGNQFATAGFQPAGQIDAYGRHQNVDLKGGGNCGWTGPLGWNGMAGAPRLQLEWIGLTGPFSAVPKSCAEARALDPTQGNGEYLLQVSGQLVDIYCHNMATTPAEYLTLRYGWGTSNYSSYGAGNTSPTGLKTSFYRLRFHPDSLLVDWNDTTFSLSTGSAHIGGSSTASTSMGFALAADCNGEYSQGGMASIDLTGTQFALVPSEIAGQGWRFNGSVDFSHGDQRISIRGGGYCGHFGPRHPTQLRLMLATVVTCAQYRAMLPGAEDGVYTLHANNDNHQPYSAYCLGMQTPEPKEYLPLVVSGSGSNYSRQQAGGAIAGTDVVTTFSKVRIQTPRLTYLKTDDLTFASSTGQITTWGVTSVPYGFAGACMGPWNAAGTGNVDLNGTPFSVAPNAFAVRGWQAGGSATYSSDSKRVDLTGGGWCGDIWAVNGLLPLTYVGL
ncbi:GON domain-containing protein [Corallococcus terminator]